jgi:hypothetical protein
MSVLYAKPRIKPARKTVRKPGPFGRGVFPPVRPFEPSHADRIDLATMATVPDKPTPLPRAIKEIIGSSDRNLAACANLLKTIDRHVMRISGIRPICGGSPEADTWASRIEAIMNGIDDDDANPVRDSDVANVAAVG